MNTWIAFFTALIGLATAIFAWCVSDSRRIREIEKLIKEEEKRYAEALAKNDTVAISMCDIELRRLRQVIGRIKDRR